MRSAVNVVFVMVVCLSAVEAMLPDTGADVIKERPKKSVLHHVSAFEVVSLDSTHFMKQTTTYADPHSSSRVAASGLSSGNAFWDSVETHPRLSSFSLSAFGLNFNVKLHKNEELFGPGYVQERRVYRDGKYFPAESTSRGLLPSEDCNYHGHVTESTQGSLVAVSTCRGGFEGLINAHGESFTILPAQHHMGKGEIQSHVQKLGLSSAKQGSLHILFRQSDYFEAPFGCGVTAVHEAARELRKESSEELNNVLYVVPKGRNEFGFGDQHHPRRHLLQSQKYVELVVFNDKMRFESLDDQTEITSNAQVNIQDGIYRATTSFQPNVQIVLIRQMTFINQDPWTTPIMGPTQSCPSCTAQEVDVDDLLAKFHSYRSVPANAGAHDNGQLFSGYDFQATVLGYAGVGTMCLQSQSGGINQATFANPNFNAAISTHEMGHNFDMRHDSSGNACPQSGFIMNAAVGQNPPTQFSTCSVTYYNAFIVSDDPTCLNNVPTEHWGDPVCGNGFVEAGEACDCGAPNCANTPNVCCNGATCNFTASAECSIGSPCCDNQCKIIRDTTRVCRASAGSCDFAETCDGIGERCPNDEFVGAGTACTDATYGEGMCYAGVCMSHLRQCRDVGSRFQGAPFDNCPADTQTRLNQGNFCGSMWCTNDPNSCTTFRLSTEIVSMANGVPCGGGQQCKDRQCVASQALNTAFSWSTGELSPCYDCSELQNRSVSCMRLNGVIRDPVFCTPSAKPPEKVQCTNETLGCVHTGPCDASSDVDFFSQCIPRNTILFGGLGAVSLFLVALACCYQAVTWGSEDEVAKKDDLGPYGP